MFGPFGLSCSVVITVFATHSARYFNSEVDLSRCHVPFFKFAIGCFLCVRVVEFSADDL